MLSIPLFVSRLFFAHALVLHELLRLFWFRGNRSRSSIFFILRRLRTSSCCDRPYQLMYIAIALHEAILGEPTPPTSQFAFDLTPVALNRLLVGHVCFISL